MILDRRRMRDELAALLALLMRQPAPVECVEPAPEAAAP